MIGIISRAISILNAVGIDARLIEYWRGNRKCHAIILLNVESLEDPLPNSV